MSYDIYIGNAEIEVVEDIVGNLPLSYRVVVNAVELSDAPTFPGDENTGKSNVRQPGYDQWTKFCRIAGLDALFFDREVGLMCEQPSVMALREEHANVIEQALARWKQEHPDAVPGFHDFFAEGENGQYDGILARLIWLDFWVKWALKHCERPAIWNW